MRVRKSSATSETMRPIISIAKTVGRRYSLFARSAGVSSRLPSFASGRIRRRSIPMTFSFWKTNISLFIALTFSVLPVLLAAQEPEDNHPVGFTAASLCGNYGAIATYGANVARALAFEVMDGHGKITAGSAVVNQPGPNNTRSLSTIGISGTYTINADGMGKMNLTIELPGGSTASVTEDFVVTKSKVVDGVAIATEIQDAQEVPSAVIDDTSLVTHTYTLRGSPHSCSSGR
jgi:hypothetical protein